MKRLQTLSALLLAGLGLAACARGGGASLVPAALHARTTSSAFQFVGYWDGWQKNNLVKTPTGVSEIPLAFGFIHGHTITLKNGINAGYVTAQDIRALQARGIKVTLSLGGASPRTAFVFDGNVQGFEASLTALLKTLPLDGVDFDLEHGSTASRVKTLTTLIPATRAYFNANNEPNAIVTYTAYNYPTDYGDDQILKNSQVGSALSWVNVMSYNNHADQSAVVSDTESNLTAYGKIFDPARLMMGVDIDDRPIPSDASLATLSAWARSNGFGGMMAWTVNAITPQQLAALTTGS